MLMFIILYINIFRTPVSKNNKVFNLKYGVIIVFNFENNLINVKIFLTYRQLPTVVYFNEFEFKYNKHFTIQDN